MRSFLKRRYNFADISVMMRVEDGKYLNVTDLNLTEDKEYIELNGCDSEFVFCFCTFCKQEMYAAPVTYEELVELSRTKKVIQSITETFKKEEENYAVQIGVQVAAKKILNSTFGYAEQRIEEEEMWYDFKRCLRPVGEDGKRRKVYTTVLSKKFERVV